LFLRKQVQLKVIIYKGKFKRYWLVNEGVKS
jgi:hypothetical protein